MLMAPVGMASIGGDGALLAEPHDRALAELLLDLADGHLDRPRTFLVVVCHAASAKPRHRPAPCLNVAHSLRGRDRVDVKRKSLDE